MDRVLRVVGVLITAAVLYFTIPVLVDAVRGTSLGSPPDWFQSFWDWSRPFRFVVIIAIISISIISAVVDGNDKKFDDKQGKESK